MHLYHLSYDEGFYSNDDTKKLYPRIPLCRYEDKMGNAIEDDTTPRVCMAPSIMGCLNAIYDKHGFGIYAVYGADVDDSKCVKPTKEQVPDVDETGEVWVMGNVLVYLKYYIHAHNKEDGTLVYEVVDLD